jgi:hypothetical protein
VAPQFAAFRTDVYIENDSGGFSVIPSSALERIIKDDRNNDRAIVEAYQAMLMMLHGDDSFPARLVVGFELTEEEDLEWIARATWRLSIPCGRLLLCGGFDPRILAGWLEGSDSYWAQTVRAIDVPAGDFVVDLYTHRRTISGRFLEEEWPMPLGAWFRKEHPDEPFPAWMAEELEQLPELDPGHESDWANRREAERAGRLLVAPTPENVIGYLVHLRPFDSGITLSALPDDGWFEPETGSRVPPRCPIGLSTMASPD